MNDLRCMTDLFPFLMALPTICEFGVATNAGIPEALLSVLLAVQKVMPRSKWKSMWKQDEQ